MFVATNRIRTQKGFGDRLGESSAILGGIGGQTDFAGFQVRLVSLPLEEEASPLPNEALGLL